MDIGFIGLGNMGLAMARNLVGAGHRLRAWNRSPIAPGALPGATLVETPAEAFAAEVVFTMLADDAAIRAVLLDSGVLAGAAPGTVHVVSATISPTLAEELETLHLCGGLGYLSAPVFGRPDAAATAQLSILAAGDPATLAKVRPLFDVIGRRTFVLGDRPAQANIAKLAGNMMIAMAIESMAEAVALTEAHGIDRATFLDLLLQTLFGCRVYETYGHKIATGDYSAGFKMSLGLKDLRLATEAAGNVDAPLVMLNAVRARMSAAIEAGLGEQDWSGIADYGLRGATTS